MHVRVVDEEEEEEEEEREVEVGVGELTLEERDTVH